MRIVTARRISQVFFFALFIWLCIVTAVGDKFWQLRHWPVNLFLSLDPLVAIGTILTTQTLYWHLLLALATIILTIILGRFFCSWVCPFGSIHHFVGYLGKRSKPAGQRIKLNRYRKAQGIKYFVLAFLLAGAAFPSISATLQTGLLDPIPLVSRSVNLVLLPIADKPFALLAVTQRLYELAGLIFAVFAAAVLLNLFIPRFYCRFVCPLGALFGVVSRFAIWRIGKNKQACTGCKFCEQHCEGGCEPATTIKIAECVLCFNCRDDCKKMDDCISYQTVASRAGEHTNPDISRRGFILSVASGVLAVPAIRLAGKVGKGWYYKVVRPPGALAEAEFLKRCIKCGQCIKVCPTNVLQPAGIEGGIEGLWTPILNNRIGTSGCQYNCVACGSVCPTSAIRAISLDEKMGKGKFASKGPIKLGTAFVDRNRCLPCSMNKPCIVCEENCPVSPKAIYTAETFNAVRNGRLTVKKAVGSTSLTTGVNTIETAENGLPVDKYGTGDYYCIVEGLSGQMRHPEGEQRWKIRSNTENTILCEGKFETVPAEGAKVIIQVRLQRPLVDIERCIGCGVCEHECPVSGLKAIRISAEGESRSYDRQLLL
jgi:polyferredoxin